MAQQNDSVAGSGYGNPYLDSLIWGAKWDGSPIEYHFASGPIPDIPGGNGSAWSDAEKNQFRLAVQLYESVANIQFQEVATFDEADIAWWRVNNAFLGGDLGAHEVPDEFFPNPIYGYFNADHFTWNSLDQGGFGFITIIHEIGHGLGLAHPHDGGTEADATRFPGVSSPASLGTYALNQGIWTTLTYNDGWNKAPATSFGFGWQGTPMALDIAALQALYGANTTYNTGNQIYELPGANGDGTFWSCIWDAGGVDEISAADAVSACTINLNDAPLVGPNAGGFVSWIKGVIGGFTIANGVVIENATGGDGNDTLIGNAADNLLASGDGNDSLVGGAGADTLDGGIGRDRMIGGAGDNLYRVDDKGDVIVETLAGPAGGIDTVESSIAYTLGANLENLVLTGALTTNGTGNTLANELTGNGAANLLKGMAGDDLLVGNGGNDTLDSGTGADTMRGGEGDDLYIQDNAGDVIEETGGSLNDELRTNQQLTNAVDNVEHYTFTGRAALDFTGSATANRITGTAAADLIDGGAGNDTVSGGGGNDALLGGAGNDVLDGGAGADGMQGGAGDDIYYVDNVKDIVDESGGSGNDTIRTTISLNLMTFAGIENIELLGTASLGATGNEIANTLTGNAGANKLDGGAGADKMSGGNGNDTYIVDDIGDMVIEAADEGTDTVFSSVSFTLPEHVENLTLTGDDHIDAVGNALNNVIVGNNGNNVIDGGAGADKMSGGKGDDTYIVDDGKDIVAETAGGGAGGGTDTVESSVSFTLGANLENLVLTGGVAKDGTGNTLANELTGNGADNLLKGMAGDDLLIGNGGNDTLDGGTGADTMRGGAGDDLYIQDNPGDVIDETGSDANDELRTNQLLTVVVANIEHYTFTGSKAVSFTADGAANRIAGTAAADSIDGGAGNDTLTGGGGNDTLIGGAGSDLLDGGAGADNMQGGAGNDIYYVDNVKDIVDEEGGGTDEIRATITFSIAALANIENLTLLGTAALNATGNEQDNVLTGNAGANKLDGGAGADTMTGGTGNDIYVVDDAGDIVVEGTGEGVDTVHSSLASYTLTANVENLVLLAGAGGGTGNELANKLTGNDGNNTLDGGLGVDILIGGKGDDVYIVDDTKDVVTEGANAGDDTVMSRAPSYTLPGNVENLVLIAGAGGIDGTGNTLNNLLTGNEGDNLLKGMAGNDRLDGGAGHDTLDGGAGTDTLVGGLGNDTYVVDNIGDVVDETGAGGTDAVQSSISFSLVENGTTVRGNIENLTLTGTAAIGGTGNDLPNVIVGNAGANLLVGGAGNDMLIGGGGNDTLIGGTGNDTLVGGRGNDVIDVGEGNNTVRYTGTLDGRDIINNFEADLADDQDSLDLDELFDSLGVQTGDRADLVEVTFATGSFQIRVDTTIDGKFNLHVATINTTNPGDAVTVGDDILVGTL